MDIYPIHFSSSAGYPSGGSMGMAVSANYRAIADQQRRLRAQSLANLGRHQDETPESKSPNKKGRRKQTGGTAPQMSYELQEHLAKAG